MYYLRRSFQKMLQVFGIRTLPPLNPELSRLEQVFQSPPFTPEMVLAIRSIAPQFELKADKKSQVFWQADQNGSCWGEYRALAPLFRTMARPARILEIGPGLGRSLVFFSKKLDWQQSQIHAYEGEADTAPVEYPVMGPRQGDSFYGNIGILRQVLAFNQINNVTIYNAKECQLSQLPGPFDFIYSFYSIGFHWALEDFLEDIMSLMAPKAVAVFSTPLQYEPSPRVAQLPHRIVEWNTVWPKSGRLKMLLLGKTEVPAWDPEPAARYS